MRIIVADCSAEYTGRLNASLPVAKRVLLIKADGSVLIFSELGSYKPLNWMVAPCTMRVIDGNVSKDNDCSCEDDDSSSVSQMVLSALVARRLSTFRAFLAMELF